METKRTLLAIALSIIVLVVFSYITPRQPVQKRAPAPPPAGEMKETGLERVAEQPPVLPAVPSDTMAAPSEEKEILVETDLYTAAFSTRGATIKRWDLKEYTGKGLIPVSLVNPDAPLAPLSLILKDRPEGFVSGAIFRADRDSVVFDGDTKTTALTFSHAGPSGTAIRKTFTFYRNEYRVDLITEVTGVESYRVVIGSGFGLYDPEGAWVHIGPLLLKDTDKIDIDSTNIEGIGFIGKLTGRKSTDMIQYSGNIRWIAQEDKYFASILSSGGTESTAVVWSWPEGGNGKKRGAEIAYEVRGDKGEFLLYAGPKRDEVLKTYGKGLEHIVDFGFFSPIAMPIFWLLKVFYRILGNYGWAIVLVTIVIRVPFIPIINKGQKSMKKLQVIQPQMAGLKEKYRNDPQKLQKETMELYKKHKVNPIGGCLPMLIQIPVFFALYKILLISIEIRTSPFILWIHDLSEKDPYYILPVLMGITMVIQQKMTPSGMDPKQAKIMMLMPVIFTFMFLTFPAGLVLYWLVSNTLGIIQQYYINKKSAAAV